MGMSQCLALSYLLPILAVLAVLVDLTFPVTSILRLGLALDFGVYSRMREKAST